MDIVILFLLIEESREEGVKEIYAVFTALIVQTLGAIPSCRKVTYCGWLASV